MSLFSKRLAIILEEKNISINRLSALAEIDASSINGFKSGDAIPDMDELIRMADILGVTIDCLAGKTQACKGFNKKYALYNDLTELRAFLLLAVEKIGRILETEGKNTMQKNNGYKLK